MSDTSTNSEFNMDSKIVIAIIAVTVTTIAAIVCTKKYVLDKKQPTSPEKRILRRKQRSMMKAIVNIEDDAKKMLNDIKKVQGIILDFMKNNTKKEKEEKDNGDSENNEKTIIENEVDNNASIDTTESVDKTIVDNEDKEEVKKEDKTVVDNEGKEEVKKEDKTTVDNEDKEEVKKEEISDEQKPKDKKETQPTSLKSIRVDGFLMEMKIKGLDEFLLRLLEQLDSLRPNALMDEAREMCAEKEGLDDVIPYVEHKVEKIKKRKKALVVKIQSYLDNVDKLASTVSGKNTDIEVVESVAKLWEVEEEAGESSNDDDKKNN